MTEKEIIIDGRKLKHIKEDLFDGRRDAISTKTFEAIIEALQEKEQECEKLKNKYYTSTTETKADLIKQIEELKIEVEKYKQTLAEIKEIAEDDCKTCTVKLLGEDEINCKRCYKTKILQKCEVIKNANI